MYGTNDFGGIAELKKQFYLFKSVCSMAAIASAEFSFFAMCKSSEHNANVWDRLAELINCSYTSNFAFSTSFQFNTYGNKTCVLSVRA